MNEIGAGISIITAFWMGVAIGYCNCDRQWSKRDKERRDAKPDYPPVGLSYDKGKTSEVRFNGYILTAKDGVDITSDEELDRITDGLSPAAAERFKKFVRSVEDFERKVYSGEIKRPSSWK